MEHTIEFRVRYEETDQMGVVYYANYLTWFEVARTEFFRDQGVDYRKLEEKDNIYLPAINASCKYMAPLRYDDIAVVTVKLANVGASRISFEYTVKKEEKVTTTGMTEHVFVNAKGVPIKIPAKVKKAFS